MVTRERGREIRERMGSTGFFGGWWVHFFCMAVVMWEEVGTGVMVEEYVTPMVWREVCCWEERGEVERKSEEDTMLRNHEKMCSSSNLMV